MLSENAYGSPAGARLPWPHWLSWLSAASQPQVIPTYGVSAADAQVIPPAGPMSREPSSTRLLDPSTRPRTA
jgi:hypothetical protein